MEKLFPFLTVENKNGNIIEEIHIGDSTDLTVLAKKLHAQNLKLKK